MAILTCGPRRRRAPIFLNPWNACFQRICSAHLCEAIQCHAVSRALLVNVIWPIEIMYFLCMLHVQHITKKTCIFDREVSQKCKTCNLNLHTPMFQKTWFLCFAWRGWELFENCEAAFWGCKPEIKCVSETSVCVAPNEHPLKNSAPMQHGKHILSYVLVCIFDCYVYCYLYWSQCLHV